jgi:hypothetical protein
VLGVHPDLSVVLTVAGRLGLQASGVVLEQANAEYGAYRARVGRGLVRLRVGRLTPRKVGLFVAVWQRAADGGTEPLTSDDGVNVLIITVREEDRAGAFVFPAEALVQHGIVSVAGNGGKRGFRMYPPWSTTDNRQAMRTQRWQGAFFLDLSDPLHLDAARARQLFGVL